jgi:hypothetical protein
VLVAACAQETAGVLLGDIAGVDQAVLARRWHRRKPRGAPPRGRRPRRSRACSPKAHREREDPVVGAMVSKGWT